jgi:DNA-binding Xre family transcriptional regulator
MTFAEKLLELLAQRRWKVVDLSRASGVSLQALSRYLSRKKPAVPTFPYVVALADALGVSVADFAACEFRRRPARRKPGAWRQPLPTDTVATRVRMAMARRRVTPIQLSLMTAIPYSGLVQFLADRGRIPVITAAQLKRIAAELRVSAKSLTA